MNVFPQQFFYNNPRCIPFFVDDDFPRMMYFIIMITRVSSLIDFRSCHLNEICHIFWNLDPTKRQHLDENIYVCMYQKYGPLHI